MGDERGGTGTEKEPKRRIELSGLQVAAATAAAVTATVVASTLGVAGTIIGAVLASVISTVGSALYLASMNHTKEKLRATVLAKSLTRVDTTVGGATVTVVEHREGETAVLDATGPGGEDGGAGTDGGTRLLVRDGSPEPTGAAPASYTGRATVTAPADPAEPGTGRRRLRSWQAVALTAVLVCALTFGLVTIAEGLLGRPLATLFGNDDGTTGTTLNHRPGPGTQPTDDDEHAPAPGTTEPTTEAPIDPSQPPATQTPSPTPSNTPTPSPSSPSPTSSPTPSTPPEGGQGEGV